MEVFRHSLPGLWIAQLKEYVTGLCKHAPYFTIIEHFRENRNRKLQTSKVPVKSQQASVY